MLASSFRPRESMGVCGEVLLELSLELLDKVVDETFSKPSPPKVDVSSGGQNLENSVVDGQEADIESSSTETIMWNSWAPRELLLLRP